MKLRIVIATLLVVVLTIPASMLAQGSKAEQEVRAVLAEMQQALLKSGAEAAALDKYLADDFTLILSNGVALTKAENLEGFRSGKTGYQKFDFSDVKVRLYGNTAVVTGIVKNIGEQAGVKNTTGSPSRFTRVFVKRDGIWKQVLNQNTRIAEPAKQ
jgi:ketosteroid isomerase-like protein